MNVYLLCDPNDGVFRYIGLTTLPVSQRLAKHIKDAKTKRRYGRYLSDKDKWILSLVDNDLKPTVCLMVDDIEKDVGILVEKNLITVCGRLNDNSGTLFNIQVGGFFNGDLATPWNRGLKDCYTEEFMANMKRSQSKRKEIYRFDTSGNFIDKWISIRTMCSELGYDRRTVQRCLSGHPSYLSHKGCVFSYSKKNIPKVVKTKRKRHNG